MAVECWQGKCVSGLGTYSGKAALAGGITGMLVGILGSLWGWWDPITGGAVAGGLMTGLGFFLWANARLTGRLRKHSEDPKVSVAGMVIKAWRMPTYWPYDGDWCFNFMIPENRRELIEEHADTGLACIRCQTITHEQATATGLPEGASIKNLHCEISSRVGTWGAVGTKVGAAVGTAAGIVAGIVAGAAVCAAIGWTIIGLVLCVLVAAIVAAAVAAAGSALGGLIGGGLGLAADTGSEEGQLADTVSLGDCAIFSGDWVTDLDHGWNEIHELEGIVNLGPCRTVKRAVALAATKDIDTLY